MLREKRGPQSHLNTPIIGNYKNEEDQLMIWERVSKQGEGKSEDWNLRI